MFEVRTDHKPLVGIFMMKGAGKASPRLKKWLCYVKVYTFVMMYVPGRQNVNADYLLRLPKEEDCIEKLEDKVVSLRKRVVMGL